MRKYVLNNDVNVMIIDDRLYINSDSEISTYTSPSCHSMDWVGESLGGSLTDLEDLIECIDYHGFYHNSTTKCSNIRL